MYKRDKREPYKKVTRNFQQIQGDYNNQAGRDINFFSYMQAKPKNIKIVAMKNFEFWYYLLSMGMSGILIWGLFKAIDSSSLPDWFMFAFFFLVLVSVVSVLRGLEWMFKNFKWGHIIYNNGAFEHNGKIHRFYEEIWAVELSRTFADKGKIEYFYIDQNSKIQSTKIVLMRYSEAKYLHDIFWSGLDIKRNIDKKV